MVADPEPEESKSQLPSVSEMDEEKTQRAVPTVTEEKALLVEVSVDEVETHTIEVMEYRVS